MSRPTISCRKCGLPHPGPRSVEQLHAEGCGVLIRANNMAVAEAREYLRSQWMGGALELAGWCSSCVFLEIATTAPGAALAELEKAALTVTQQTPTAALVEREYGEAPIHVCKILPFDQRRVQRAARDLLDIGSPKPGGAS